jgi:SAM-dependent methyltransferase
LLVDFGRSYGTLLEIFRDRNWDVLGVEISAESQTVLSHKGLRWTANLQTAQLERGSVDVLTMVDLMYYLPDLVAVLEQVAEIWKPRGVLILRQPTRGGLINLLGRLKLKSALSEKLWLDHIHMFSMRSTMLVLGKTGFRHIVFLKETGFEHSLKGEIIHWSLSFMNAAAAGKMDLALSYEVVAAKESFSSDFLKSREIVNVFK